MAWRNTGAIPACWAFSRKLRVWASGAGLKAQAWGAEAKICMVSHPISTARSIALSSPPAVDTCAPSFMHTSSERLWRTGSGRTITNWGEFLPKGLAGRRFTPPPGDSQCPAQLSPVPHHQELAGYGHGAIGPHHHSDGEHQKEAPYGGAAEEEQG